MNINKEVLLIDKPAGISSFGVVAKVRRKLSEEVGVDENGKRKKIKVGHTGTLDPFATGLLILLVGKGTKRSNDFLKLDKEYKAVIRLGATSTTGDPEGEISVLENIVEPGFEAISEVVSGFVGKIQQRVPNFSAVKINGRRAYDLARKGIEVEMPVRQVEIFSIDILSYKFPELKIRCYVSSGTYIRTLGEDIGKKLGVGGYLTELRRTKVGKFSVDDAEKLENFIK